MHTFQFENVQSRDRKQHAIEVTGGDATIDWEYELPRVVSWREFLIFKERRRSMGFIQIIDSRKEKTHYRGKEEAVKKMAINFPAYGQQRSSNELKIIVASATVRSVWVDLETFSKRLRVCPKTSKYRNLEENLIIIKYARNIINYQKDVIC
ncbi:hypothetical protein, partial [Leptospira mayottensis]|uniref:hypothetical protein n=1 Tax=Leptospira mayottensis TaxID=1137606 RepID=UPI001AEF966A